MVFITAQAEDKQQVNFRNCLKPDSVGCTSTYQCIVRLLCDVAMCTTCWQVDSKATAACLIIASVHDAHLCEMCRSLMLG
jgi:hypothetical protein